MKKTKLLLLVISIILLAISINRKKPNEEFDHLTEIKNIDLEKPVSMGVKTNSIDFGACDPSKSFKIADSSITVKVNIQGVEEGTCLVQTIFETTNGSYTNSCSVPVNIGVVEFEGSNFDRIARYCTFEN